jgi:hypothetical protein
VGTDETAEAGKMTDTEFLQARLTNQKLLSRPFTEVQEVVEWFGAIQSQDLAASLYGVGLRMNDMSAESVEAAIAAKTVIRGWPMRMTIHFMPAKDALWMVKLLGPRQNKKAASIYRTHGLSEEVFQKARSILERELLTGLKERGELYAALEAGGISTTEGKGLHIVKYWAQEGLICIGPRKGKQPTFAHFETWIDDHNVVGDEEGVSILLRRYLQSHAPATLKDFMWWTSLTKAEVSRAYETIKGDFVERQINGVTYICLSDQEFEPMKAKTVLLLPAFDEYTVAYADRSAVMGREDIREVGYGINPNVIINGVAVGMWRRALRGKKAIIQLDLFRQLTDAEMIATEDAAQGYGRFTGTEAEIEIMKITAL